VNFVAIDVETANADLANVCQIGIVSFENGNLKESWQSFVNPEDYFDPVNVAIHGIDESAVAGAPIFPQLATMIRERTAVCVVVSHTCFDRVALARVSEKYDLAPFECTWLDTARVVRRAWTELSQRGYELESVATKLGIAFAHHNAAEDARAAGEILLRAMSETGMGLSDWMDQVRKPISPSHIRMEGDPEGPLHGEVAVFTGALTITRREAAQLAAEAGCEVAPAVRQDTTLLVVGDQDIRKLGGHDKSSKRRKAEALIAKGHPIRIVCEGDFRRLVGSSI